MPLLKSRRGEKLTKEELKEIYYLNKEVKMWQRELEKLQCKSLIKGQEITGLPFGSGGNKDKVGDMATDIADIEAIIRGKLAEIQVQRKKIIEYIDGIDDSLLRQIVFLRNVSCMTWRQVARELGNTESCVKQMYSRHFKAKR